MHTVKIGLIGLGTVGGGVIDILSRHHDDFCRHFDLDLRLVRVADRNTKRFAQLGLDPAICTDDAFAVTGDPEVEIVIELIGGTGVARDVVVAALAAGKRVVTANKALMATSGHELLKTAEAQGLELRFEASVGGGIPIIEPLKHALTANKISDVLGIVNGTTNYMLTNMAERGLSYDEALAEAQALGYAEADPSADVDGLDAAAKIALLASIVFHSTVTLDQVHAEGIRDLCSTDVSYAAQMGYAIKLLAIARMTDGGIDIRVHPTMIPAKHQLAAVSGVYNAIYVTGDAVGDVMFFGEGAGAGAAASAVVGDVIEAARALSSNNTVVGCTCTDEVAIRPISELETCYYLRMIVDDKSGVLARMTAVFAAHEVSLSSIMQQGVAKDGTAEIIYVTHRAREADIRAIIGELEALDVVKSIAALIRVEAL
ncbi:MAG: homoserine dehydrogenase [Actinomycetia bacterium]|nr:homoserine dehydrogenase [Actinomycetes bacterium]